MRDFRRLKVWEGAHELALEVFRATEAGALERGTVVELGAVISGRVDGRTDDQQITVCDLTGVAVQDLMIAQAVARRQGLEP